MKYKTNLLMKVFYVFVFLFFIKSVVGAFPSQVEYNFKTQDFEYSTLTNDDYTSQKFGCHFPNLFIASSEISEPENILFRSSLLLAARSGRKLLRAANVSSKNGLTAVGRVLQKHGSRSGSLFPKAIGNPTSINVQSEAVLKGIINNPNVSTLSRHHARLGNILEYRLPSGQGARFSSDLKTFFGFIE